MPWSAEAARDYYERNKERLQAKGRADYARNRQRGIQYSTQYRLANTDRINAQRRMRGARKRADPQYRLVANLRTRISQAIGRDRNKPLSTAEGLGCTYGELRHHLESQFLPGMSWDNYGKRGWHIDHKRPLASFDLSDPKQFAEACHYTNLQPLWWIDNLKKGPRSG